jgi:selenocysteine lyase/cysteine desulfurase
MSDGSTPRLRPRDSTLHHRRVNADESAHVRVDRRSFVGAAGALAASLAWPASLTALAQRLSSLALQQDEYWRVVRSAFLIPEGRIYLNVGTLGIQPRAVIDAINEHTRLVATSFPPATDWNALRARLAALLSCDAEGLVFPRNTTEGMSFVANGLDLEPGTEILTTDHEHVGGLSCWQLAAARRRLTLRQLPLPTPPASRDQVIDVFRRAITPRTRVISISHVNFTNGLLMPVQEIIALARARNIIVVVDGAHPPGMFRFDLGAMDPDFYASSPHKWLLAAQGTGFLWLRAEWRTRLWPTLASGGWNDTTLGAHRFNHLGTFDESRLAGLDAALRFHEAVGAERVEARIRELRSRLVRNLTGIRGLHMLSPPADDAGRGMVAFQLDGVASLALQQRLADATVPAGTAMAGRRVSVRTRVIGEYNYGWMRLSPHIYNTPDEIDAVSALIAAAAP